jgi:hypothetical protein
MEIEAGESLWSMKVKIVDALVHGPQFTLVVDIDWLEDQLSQLD